MLPCTRVSEFKCSALPLAECLELIPSRCRAEMEKRLPWILKQPGFPKALGSSLIVLFLALLMQIPQGESAFEIPERDAVSVLQHWLGWGPGAGEPAPSLSGEVIVGSRLLT